MRLHELLDVSSVKIGLQGENTEEIVAELVELLVRAGRVADRQKAITAVLDREAKGSTGIGSGIALPHGKLEAIPRLTAALGISEKGVDFDAADRKPVHVVVLLLARADEAGPHVQALREASTLMSMPQFFEKLTRSRTPQEALELIRAEED
jgi:mannitol/fructose-specific phosphotransferase system IIA component (Ntr-type)